MIHKTTVQGGSRRTGLAVGIAALVIGYLAAASGCGCKGPERVAVFGRVTFRGEPIKEGEICFIPTKGADAPATGALILDGQYFANGNGGVPVGIHRIEIVAGLRKGLAGRIAQVGNSPSNLKAKEAPKKLRLPAKYNSQSELTIAVEPGSGRIVQNFALTD